jgi:DNA-binding beta-propeller fold protein YncE
VKSFRKLLDSRHQVLLGSLVAGLFLAAVLAIAPRAQAAELLFWDNYAGDPDNVAYANIDGSGGGLLNLGGSELESPEGMAYDTASGRLFVANEAGTAGQILAVNVDGSGATPFTAPGAPIEEPEGVAVDPATGTIYWSNVEGAESIVWAKLDGSAGGVLNTSGAPLNGPCCRLAIDPVGGRVYWVNTDPDPNNIGFANLNNTGGGELNLTGSTVEPGGEGLSVDSATGRLYFLGGVGPLDEIGYANLNGTGGGDISLGGAVIDGPWGLAFDPSISRLYWANEGNEKGEGTNAFGFVSPSGGPGGNISAANALVAGPQDPVIIKSPAPGGAPSVTRNAKTRSKLSCSQGTWGADYPGSFVYQAPRSYAYQWTRNGKPVSGAAASTLSAKSGGKYACLVAAANQAGSTSQTSGAVNVKAAKLKLSAKKAGAQAGGVATFKVKVVNQGDVKSKKAKLCAKVPKKDKSDLKARKCSKLPPLTGRAKRTVKIKLEVLPSADGTYKVTFKAKGVPGKAAKGKLVVH